VDTVEAEVDIVEKDGHVVGVKAICTKCHHETESRGTSDASVRRCLALLREECPQGEHNFYEGEL
jgi:hypothetical protein